MDLVKISYAILDIISVQFKITVVAYAKSLKETQSQDRHNIYPKKPSKGRKPSQNLLCIRCIRYNPKNMYSPPCCSVFVSPIHCSSE